LVTARADPAIQHELAHAERKELRRFVPAVNALHVPNLEGRLINRPEGERDDRCAFPQFFAAGFTYRGPFPERKTF
jgi:hypothetical protein